MRGVKTGGRCKGTPNKVSKGLKSWVNDFLQRNVSTIESDFAQLEPKERIQYFEKLMAYIVPKQQSVTSEIDLSELSDNQLDEIISRITDETT